MLVWLHPKREWRMFLAWKEWSGGGESVSWWIMLERLLLKGGLLPMTKGACFGRWSWWNWHWGHIELSKGSIIDNVNMEVALVMNNSWWSFFIIIAYWIWWTSCVEKGWKRSCRCLEKTKGVKTWSFHFKDWLTIK